MCRLCRGVAQGWLAPRRARQAARTGAAQRNPSAPRCVRCPAPCRMPCAHASCIPPMCPVASRSHHHKYPMDFDRLVFPPPIAALIIGLFHLLLHALMPLVRRAAAGGAGEAPSSRPAPGACPARRATHAAAPWRARPPPAHPSPVSAPRRLACRPGRRRCWGAAWWAMFCTTPPIGRCTLGAPTGCSAPRSRCAGRAVVRACAVTAACCGRACCLLCAPRFVLLLLARAAAGRHVLSCRARLACSFAAQTSSLLPLEFQSKSIIADVPHGPPLRG